MLNHTSVTSRFYRECRALLTLSLPIIISQLATAAMNFVDTSMAGQVSAQDLAAIGVGGSLWLPASLLLRGILMALTPIITHHRGAGADGEITRDFTQTIWIALICSALLSLYLCQGEPILRFMNVVPEVITIARDYLMALAFGVPGIALFYTANSFCEGMGDTFTPMVIAVTGLVLNIPLNYVLIYGKFGAPALGAIGCGWATSLVYWMMAGLMVLSINRHPRHQRHLDITQIRPTLERMAAIVRLGLPIGVNIFVCGSIFAAIALLIGKLGANSIAAHQIALTFSSLTYMIPMSLSFGITIRVGHALGQGLEQEARLRGVSGLLLAACCAALSSCGIVLFVNSIIRLYTPDPLVAKAAAVLLGYAAIYQISDALQSSANGVLRGYKDTRIPMMLVTFAYWGVTIPMGYTLGLTDLIIPAMGAAGFWVGLIIGLTLAALLLLGRLTWILLYRQRTTYVTADPNNS